MVLRVRYLGHRRPIGDPLLSTLCYSGISLYNQLEFGSGFLSHPLFLDATLR